MVEFLLIFLPIVFLSHLILDTTAYSFAAIVGSLLLLNSPSIGYVWVMRVFLMMALLTAPMQRLSRRIGFYGTTLLMIVLILTQQLLASYVCQISNSAIHLVADQILLYAVGYSVLLLLGLKIKDFSRRQLILQCLLWGGAIVGICWLNGGSFDPQSFKYPPRGLYLIFGIFAVNIIYALRPILVKITDCKFFLFLSRNSMWIYLWHIIPLYFMSPWLSTPNMWIARCLIVLGIAIALTMIQNKIKTLYTFAHGSRRQ